MSNYRHLHAQTFFDRVLAHAGDFFDRYITLRRFDKIVVLTKEDKETNWKGWNNIHVIPNPRSFTSEQASTLQNPIVVSAGRLNRQKNYKDLIEAFGIVAQKHPDWKLEIYGEGEEKEMLEGIINLRNLSENVFLKGLSTNIREDFRHASIAAFTSIYEGFPLTFVEAQECGLPIISYSCPCGPKDIINEAANGFLINLGDIELFAKRICELIENPQKLKKMSIEAKRRAADFSTENITQQWVKLFEQLSRQ